jgi:O-antigen ligase
MQGALSGVRPAAAYSRARPALLWTDYWFLLGISIAALVVVDPLEWELSDHLIIKHLALLVSVPAVVMALLGRTAVPGAPHRRNEVRPLAQPLGVAWPLFLFALLAVAGSLYARFALGITNTFLNEGLYVTMLFCAAAMVLQSGAPLALLRGYFAVLTVSALVMSALLIANAGERQVYHEQIFLVIPMAALVFAGRAPPLVRWMGAAFFVSMAWFSHKYTSYLLAALTLAYLACLVWLPRLPRGDAFRRLTMIYWGALVLAAALAGAAVYALQGGPGEPSGNLEFRLHTYTEAWERFLESPLWGTLFAHEAAERFTLYDIGIAGNVLPTHSDLLDLLANGGVLVFGLAAAGVCAIAAAAWRSLLRPRLIDSPAAVYGHTLALMSLAAILTCAFNPILLQPSMAALVWSNLGMLLGLSLRTNPPAEA